MSSFTPVFQNKRLSVQVHSSGYSALVLVNRPPVCGAAILLYCPATSRFLLVKERRPSPDLEMVEVWNLPRGGTEPGHSTVQTAQKELVEEAGIHLPIRKFKLLGNWQVDAGVVANAVAFYVAEVESESVAKPDQIETFDAQWFSVQDLFKLNKNNEFMDLMVFSALGLYSAHALNEENPE